MRSDGKEVRRRKPAQPAPSGFHHEVQIGFAFEFAFSINALLSQIILAGMGGPTSYFLYSLQAFGDGTAGHGIVCFRE